MKKAVVAIVLVLAIVGIVLWRHRGSAHKTAPGSPHAAPTTQAPTTYRSADGVEHAIPAWMFMSGAPARRIAGRVLFHGDPVKDASVALQSMLTTNDLVAPIEKRTDAQGRFDFGVVPATAYDVTAIAPNTTAAIEHVELSDPVRKPAADQLELVLGDCTTSVEGTVYDASNNPLPKVRVRRDGLVGTETDPAGHYKTCVPFGDVELHYAADGYGAVVLTIDARGEMVRDLVLVPEAAIGVRAVRADNGEPVEGAFVTANPAAWGPDRARPSSGITNADGRVRLDSLVPGRYHVFAFGDALLTAAPVEVLAEVGAPADVTLKLVATAKITGHVLAGTTPLAGVQVSAIRKAPVGRSPASFTQADGAFSLDRVPVGDVGFIAAPYEVESPTSLVTEAGKSYDVTIKVHALGAIRGRALRLGKPVPGVQVCCVRTVSGLQPTTTTKLDGTYEFLGVPAGEYDLQSGSDELGAFNMPAHVKLAAGEQKTVDLDLDMAGAITGTVVDKEGKPVPGVFVRWIHQASGDLGRCMTDAQGHYRCGAMTGGGTYRAAVFPSAELQAVPYPTATGAPYPTVDVADGKSLVEGITIAIDHARGAIAGRVTDDAGAPVADAVVKALPVEGAAPPLFNSWLRLPMTSTDADGAFTVGDLAPGHYALQATAADGSEGTATGVEAGAKGVSIKIERAGSISGTLAGFTRPPVVYAKPQGAFKLVAGAVEGATFRISGLRPGRYLVNAQTSIEGDVANVDVKAGQDAKVTLTSRGQGVIEASVLDFRTKKPIAGAACHVVMQLDGRQSDTNWDFATAPRSDANGRVLIDPAPAGSISVLCDPEQFKWSRPSADLVLEKGGRATPQLLAVELSQDNPTSTGAELDWRVTPPRIATVRPNTPAAAAGLLPGDLITAVDGVSVAGLNGSGVSVLISCTAANADVKLTFQRGTVTKTVTVKATHMPG